MTSSRISGFRNKGELLPFSHPGAFTVLRTFFPKKALCHSKGSRAGSPDESMISSSRRPGRRTLGGGKPSRRLTRCDALSVVQNFRSSQTARSNGKRSCPVPILEISRYLYFPRVSRYWMNCLLLFDRSRLNLSDPSIASSPALRLCLTFVAGIRFNSRMHLIYFSIACWLAH